MNEDFVASQLTAAEAERLSAPIDPTPTYGQKAVGLTFNPSGDPLVQRVKELYAEIIDLVNNSIVAVPSERTRLAKIAITEAQTAQMWAVKAFTWKD